MPLHEMLYFVYNVFQNLCFNYHNLIILLSKLSLVLSETLTTFFPMSHKKTPKTFSHPRTPNIKLTYVTLNNAPLSVSGQINFLEQLNREAKGHKREEIISKLSTA